MYDWLSFTTDYGTADGFVAACHGVIGSIAPHARVIDVTHQIRQGDVARAARVLADTLAYLPPAVHIAVVDPGVGTHRRGVALAAGSSILVGPDNGLLLWAAETLGGVSTAVSLTNADLHRRPVSPTFHGRDVFAPVAAHLAAGVPLADAGDPLDPTSLVRLPPPFIARGDDWVDAEVLSVDRFGNVQFAVGVDDLARLGRVLRVGGTAAMRGDTFGDAPLGALVVFVDSAGKAAVAVNGGRAVDALRIGTGDIVRIEAASRR